MYLNVYEFYGDIANDLFKDDFGDDISLFKVSVITEPEKYDIRLLHENYRISKIMSETYGGEVKDHLSKSFFHEDKEFKDELRFLKLAKLDYELEFKESTVAEIDVIRDKMLLTSFMTMCLEYDFPDKTKH
jgi:hypothetical protein